MVNHVAIDFDFLQTFQKLFSNDVLYFSTVVQFIIFKSPLKHRLNVVIVFSTTIISMNWFVIYHRNVQAKLTAASRSRRRQTRVFFLCGAGFVEAGESQLFGHRQLLPSA